MTSFWFMAKGSEFPGSWGPMMLRSALLGSPQCTHGRDGHVREWAVKRKFFHQSGLRGCVCMYVCVCVCVCVYQCICMSMSLCVCENL